MTPYTPPERGKDAFHCPHCRAFAHHIWTDMFGVSQGRAVLDNLPGQISSCSHCDGYTVWFEGDMIYPDSSLAPMPNPDLPEGIRTDFEEARTIVQRSPRGAAALFRLCIQKLCAHLGEPGKNINNDIAALVKKRLNPKIEKNLDV